MITIDVQDMQKALNINTQTIRGWATGALKLLNIHNAELSIVLVDDAYIKQLNKSYLGKDRPTNVISFSQQEGSGPIGKHLGDIVISVERALAEASDADMYPMERLMQLLIHGICHLTGYNHEDVSEEQAFLMESKEADIISRLVQYE